MPADYDGDRKEDIRGVPQRGLVHSSLLGWRDDLVGWGEAGGQPVPRDYDGDGKADIAVYRNGDWFILAPRMAG